MFVTRLSAIRFTLIAIIIPAGCAGHALAQSGESWRPAGVVRPTHGQPAAGAPNNDVWKLPNSRQSGAPVDTNEDQSNPLRKKEKQNDQNNESATTREPRTFQPPVTATKLSGTQSAADRSPKTQPQPSARIASVASANRPIAVASRQANVAPRPLATNRGAATAPPAHQHRPQTNQVRRAYHDSSTTSLWNTINVAFQGEAPTEKKATENLPSPTDSKPELEDPVMHHFDGPGAFIGPYQPYGDAGPYGGCECGPDGCCDPCGCGSACGDPGCACEPGCGCEPGCSCDRCCERDLFCIGPGDDEACHTVRLRWPKWQEVMVFGGVQGFKGPYDQDRDSGNFGFNQGFNIGAKIPYAQLGYQFGWRGTQNQLNGDKDTGIEEQHFQQFATAGIFHRQCDGLNFGVVWDMLNDERWLSRRFHQMRSEISLMDGGRHEIGFTGIFGGSEQEVNEITFKPSDQFLLFYRLHGYNGGEGRFFVGLNDDSDGIIGSDMLLPVGDRFSVSAGFTYLIPDAPNGTQGATEEAWNIGVGLVWHWDHQARKCFENCYRPLFNVADNGTLIIDQR